MSSAHQEHRAALEARTLALASGGMVHGGNFANAYAPSLEININDSGNPRNDASLASQIAAHN
ncbi:hypothetical protein [Mesorhizobium sp. M0618]|uniref:hypothetical protein n=1 Tax=unclassified Mesorhizobium TaxID=325217 RepID=UPI00333B5A0E